MMSEFQNGDLVELVDDISRYDRDYSLDGEDYKKGHRFVVHSTGPMMEFEIDRYGVGSYWVYIGSPQWGWVSNTKLRIVNRAIAKLEKSMATGVPPDMSRHDATSLDLSDKNKDSQISANPEINPFEE